MFKEIIKLLKDKFHLHRYNKKIVSKYHSFNYRKVIVECVCGKRNEEVMNYDYEVYPFPTTNFISEKEYQKCLKRNIK